MSSPITQKQSPETRKSATPTFDDRLFKAIDALDESLVQELVDNRIDVKLNGNSDNEYGPRPLDKAIRSEHEGIACILIRAGAEAREFSQGSVIVDALRYKMFVAAKLMLERASPGVLEEFVSIKHANPLFDFAEADNFEAADIFLSYGAKIDEQDKNDNTALLIAVQNGCQATTKVLLTHSARLDLTKRDGQTVFDLAMKNNHVEIARMILDKFCSNNGILNTADMALDKALREGDLETTMRLLETGADFASRMTRSIRLPGEESCVGAQNEYLSILCSKVLSLKNSIETDTESNPHGPHTGSDQAFLCASQWLLTCLTQHSNCIKAEGPLPVLPSRVIDVGPADGSEIPHLVQTESRRGRYIALSHRWGGSNITKTTKKNIPQRLAGIKFDDLTKTMQDAVTITRKLGIRYLWIDAICIIQDSHSDWSVEACDMANIYRNAILTIAAASAVDHSKGCFSSRDAVGSDDILDSRGWILQEQLLSQRVLKYAFGRIEWECISLSATDSNAAGGSAMSDVMKFKRALGGFRSTSMALQGQAHASWMQIVKSYSYRTLTNDADKLMAVMGIAKFTGTILQDTFLAGLWEGQLWRDLLWSSDSACGGTRLKCIKLPSWSWASVGGGVSYKWPSGSSPTYLESKMELVSADMDQEISDGDVSGRLVVRSTLRKVTRGKGSQFESTRLYPYEEGSNIEKGQDQAEERNDNVTRKWNLLHKFTLGLFGRSEAEDSKLLAPKPPAAARQIESLPTEVVDYNHKTIPSSPFWPDVESEAFEEAWLMPVASEHYWVHCLVLVRAGDSYRRVGIGHVDNLRHRTFFGDLVPQNISLV